MSKLNSSELLTLLESKKELPAYKYKQYIEQGFVYGSVAYGGFVYGKSDLDIALPPKYLEEFQSLCEDGYAWYEPVDYSGLSDSFRTLYVKYKDAVINLSFVYHDEVHEIYRKATDAMVAIKQKGTFREEIKDKKFRVALFESLVNLLSGCPK